MKEKAGEKRNFKIPIFPHVKKFIIKNYCKDGVLPLRAGIHTEEYNVLGKSVTLALRDNRAHMEHNDQYRDRLTETITLILTKNQSDLSPRLHKLIRINIDMDRIFKDHLLVWIRASKASGLPPHAACKSYLADLGIDESEYSLDAAYQFWRRSKKGITC